MRTKLTLTIAILLLTFTSALAGTGFHPIADADAITLAMEYGRDTTSDATFALHPIADADNMDTAGERAFVQPRLAADLDWHETADADNLDYGALRQSAAE